MPIDADMKNSLAYRRNEAAILRGDVPAKYTRLLPYISGETIVEAGSAEGVLACLLARGGRRKVTAIEASEARHNDALSLAQAWGVSGITFIHDKIQQSLSALEGADSFVAVRAIYYWGEHLDDVFAAVARHIPNVTLCGNAGRARRWHAGTPDAPLGEMNRYASAEGMRDVLTRHGYEIVAEVLEGDPIVVGRR